jgi:hypothetical protein
MEPAGWVALISAIVGTGVSVKGQKDQARAVKQEAEAESRREGDAARTREIERRRALMRALASQTAEAGAMGVAPDKATAKYDIESANLDSLTDTVNTRGTQNSLSARGRNASRAARYGAAADLLGLGGTGADLYSKFGKP